MDEHDLANAVGTKYSKFRSSVLVFFGGEAFLDSGRGWIGNENMADE